MLTKTFADEYQRTEEGFINFGRDVELRRKLFVSESMNHPAKLNLNLLQCLIDYLTEPGDTLLDPMSGTGSLMMATEPVELNRKVVCIEDVPLFHYIQTLNRDKFVDRGVLPENITLLHGPCQEYLPMMGFFSHIIFSPPYADVMVPPGQSEGAKMAKEGKRYQRTDGTGESKSNFGRDREQYNFEAYQGASRKNLGAMSTFFFNQEATKIYKMLLDSLKPSGTMTVVIQDKMKGGKREGLSDWVMRTCIRSGFELKDWFKRYSPGTGMKNLLRSKGVTVVDDEDILVLRKPL